jgi:hypothetical protein
VFNQVVGISNMGLFAPDKKAHSYQMSDQCHGGSSLLKQQSPCLCALGFLEKQQAPSAP